MRKPRRNPVLGIFLIALATMLVLATNVFIVAIGKVHLRSGTDLSAYADSASTVRETTKALRGNIYDRNGTIIAEDNRTYNIVCILDPNRIAADNQITYVKDKEGTARILSDILRADYDTILNFLNQNVYQTELGNAGRNLSESTKRQIEAQNLPGIEFTDSIERVYPLGQFASNLIGYAQSDESGSTVGRMGAELYLNSYLQGQDGYRVYQADKNGYILPGMREEVQSAVNGDNVYLTIDQQIQEALEESFAITERRFHSTRIWGAVMEISTGKILAWGQYPSFDPNTLEIQDYNNYGTQLPYEPGSTLKSFTWAAAINEGKYVGTTPVDGGRYCYSADSENNPIRATGNMEAYGCIYNAGKRDWGMTDYDHGLMYSANTIAAQVQNDLISPQIDLDYLKKFGFFQAVHSDGLPEETGTYNFYYPMEKLAISYGQGCTVTMLQMLQAYSAIFGNGTMVRPYYVESIRSSYDNNDVVYQAETKETGNPISEASAREVQSILYRTVNDDEGTAKYYKIDDVTLMGKTGTTQVAINGSYASGYTIASFMGAIPGDRPQYIIYYAQQAIYNPNAHYFTEATQNLIRAVARRTGLAKTAEEETAGEEAQDGEEAAETEEPVTQMVTGTMPALINHTVAYAAEKLDGLNTDIYTLGAGNTIIDQYPEEGDEVRRNEKVFLLTDTNGFLMPDMTGWTRKEVTAFWQVTQFAFKLEGNGKVTSQNIPAGSVATRGEQIEVTFE